MGENSPSDERAQLRQRAASAEAALQQVLRREQAVARMRRRILDARQPADLFPGMIADWMGELADLGIPLCEVSLQRPASQAGYFLDYRIDVDRAAAEPAQRLLTAYPWIGEVCNSGKPRVVKRACLQKRHYAEKIQTLLALPLGGEESLCAASSEPEVFNDGTVGTVQRFAELIAESLLRLEELDRHSQSENRLRLALRAAGIAGWEWDLKTGQILWSENLASLLGLQPDSFSGDRSAFIDRVHPQDREAIERLIERTLEEDANYDIEFRLVWPDGKNRQMHAQGRVFFSRDGTANRMTGVIMDITQYKQLEEQLYQSQKMEAIGRLAGGIAHDFNNMLQIITGYCHLLASDLNSADPRYTLVEEIRSAGERAEMMTNQLLTFSRKQNTTPQSLDLNAIIGGMEKMLGRLIGENIEIAVLLGENLGKVLVDLGQLEQIVMNLAINARDAMPQGGTLAIETASVSLNQSYTHPHGDLPPGPYITLAVRDSGHGMDRETMTHIFEPFFSTKGHLGTGLGLATVYGIVEQAQGTIKVQSRLHHGTTFTVYLPRIEPTGEEQTEHSSLSAASRGTETILVVEDNEAICRLVRIALSGLGYSLLEAASSEEALQLCGRQSEPIHLLLTDIVLPGMSGVELAQQLKSRYARMRVLCMSGYAGESFTAQLNQQLPFIQKPFSPADLAARVREILDDPGSAEA